MANALITLAYRVRGYGAPAKGVLVRLADLAREDGTDARPTVARLADELELSERAVQDALKRLRQAGVIAITKEAVGTWPRVYRLNVSLMRQLAEAADQSRAALGVQEAHPYGGAGYAPVQDVHPSNDARGAGRAPPGVQDVHPHPPLHPVSAGAVRADAIAEQVKEIAGVDETTHANWHQAEMCVARWLGAGCTPDDILTGVRIKIAGMRAAGQAPPHSPKFFDHAVANARAARLAPMPTAANGGHHAQRPQRLDPRYDTGRRRAAGVSAVMADDLGAGPDPAGYG